MPPAHSHAQEQILTQPHDPPGPAEVALGMLRELTNAVAATAERMLGLDEADPR